MRTLAILGGVWLLTVLGITSDAGVNIIGVYYMMFGGFALAARWLVLFNRRQPGDAERPGRAQWLVVPAYIVVVIVFAFLEGPRNPLFRARFRLSESALTSEAQRLAGASEPERLGRHRVGLFFVRTANVYDGQVRLITTGCGVVDSCGLVYSPISEPHRVQEDIFTPLGGRWWHLMEGF